MTEPKQESPRNLKEELNNSVSSSEKSNTAVQKLFDSIEKYISTLSQKGHWREKIIALTGIWITLYGVAFQYLPISHDQINQIGVPGLGLLLLIFIIHLLIRKKDKEIIIIQQYDLALNGAFSFEEKDYDTFKKLHRGDKIEQLISAIQHHDFRFGILMGVSGCGKTSLLEAGLKPELKKLNFHCLVIRITNEFPEITIIRALKKQFELDLNEGDDLQTVLIKSIEKAEGHTIVLFFDQFEQFFFQYKSSESRSSFINSLSIWYKELSDWPLKILISIRSDFAYKLLDMQRAMAFNAILDSNFFELPKFTVTQAVAIFEVIVKERQLLYESEFLRYLCEGELADDEGSVLAADIQLIADVLIRKLLSDEKMKFNEESFAKLGGVNGLLFRYLNNQFKLPAPANAENLALRVIITLIDFENGIQKPPKTKDEIQKALGNQVPDNDLQSALNWLVELRLIHQFQKEVEDKIYYELAHERLIEPIRMIALKIENPEFKINNLLDERVNIWVGNKRNKKYLLTRREYNLVNRNFALIQWKRKINEKEALLLESKQAITTQNVLLTGVGSLFLVILITFFWYNFTTSGYIYQLRKTVNYDIKEIPSKEHPKFAVHFFNNRKPSEVHEIWKVASTRNKIEIIDTITTLSIDNTFSKVLSSVLDSVVQSANKLNDSDKAYIFPSIAMAAAQLQSEHLAKTVLDSALQSANKLSDSYKATVLSSIAEAAAQLQSEHLAKTVLDSALQSANKLNDSYKATVLSSIAEAAAQLQSEHLVKTVLDSALQSANKLNDSYKARALSSIAKAAAQLQLEKLAETVLDSAFQSANKLNDSDKARALSSIAEAAAQLQLEKLAETVLDSAFQSANKLYNYVYDYDLIYDIAITLSSIAIVAAQLKSESLAKTVLDSALQSANKMSSGFRNFVFKDIVLSGIAMAAVKLRSESLAKSVLDSVLQLVNKWDDLDKAGSLSIIATAAVKLRSESLAKSVLDSVLQSANQLSDSYKNKVLSNINLAFVNYERKYSISLPIQPLLHFSLISGNTEIIDAILFLPQIWAKKLNLKDTCMLLVKHVASFAEDYDDAETKSYTSAQLSYTYAQLGDFSRACYWAQQTTETEDIAYAHLGILTAWDSQTHTFKDYFSVFQ